MRKYPLRKLAAGVLSVCMLCTAAPMAYAAGLDSFTRNDIYVSGMFTDVPSNAWYAQNVATAYELGLMKGSSSNRFSPTANLTVAEMLTMACRIHSIYYTGTAEFAPSTPWYQTYVDYAVENGIITAGQFSNYEANATRAQFAAVLANAVPAEALQAINTIADGQIPDVPAGSYGYDAIYRLYRAGILAGNDAYGTFTPNASIERSAVAALVTRIADPDLRQHVSLQSASLNFDVYWQNSIQALNVYEFRKDGTCVRYDGEPGQAIAPSTLHEQQTGRYQVNGSKITLTWSNGTKNVLDIVTPASLTAQGISMSNIAETVPAGTQFFYDTSFAGTDVEQALYMVPTQVKVQTQSQTSNLYSGSRLTVTGTLTEMVEQAPNGSDYHAYILKLPQPKTWVLRGDPSYEGETETINQIQVSFAQGNVSSLLGQQITVSGDVLFAHTAYHLTTVVLLDAAVQ